MTLTLGVRQGDDCECDSPTRIAPAQPEPAQPDTGLCPDADQTGLTRLRPPTLLCPDRPRPVGCGCCCFSFSRGLGGDAGTWSQGSGPVIGGRGQRSPGVAQGSGPRVREKRYCLFPSALYL